MLKKKTDSRKPHALSLVALFWLISASVAAATEFPGMVKLEMNMQATDLELFQSYLEALEYTSDQELMILAEGGREIVTAVDAQNFESYLAAKAIYGYRLETLSEDALAAQRVVSNKILQLRENPKPEPASQLNEKISVTYGCGAQLTCADNSVISCSCANGQSNLSPPSSCVYKPNYSPAGGQVICDCSGSSYDTTRTCTSSGGGGIGPIG